MPWGTTVPLVADLGFPRKDKGPAVVRMVDDRSYRRQHHEGYPQIVFLFPTVDSAVDNSGQGLLSPLWGTRSQPVEQRYFHCVETPNPAAMKPKPTTMFQLPSGSIGSLPSVT